MRYPLTAVLALVLFAGQAEAQQRSGAGLGVGIYGGIGAVAPDASKSVEAVTGKTTLNSWTVGGRVTGLWRNLFADVALSQQQLEGERVFLHNGTVYSLGIPLTATFTPMDAALGWQFGDPDGRFHPYAGVGATRIKYEEAAKFAVAGDDVSGDATGVLVMGGLDVTVLKWVAVGADLRYRKVTGVLGESGISADYAENQLGGTAVTFRLVIGREGKPQQGDLRGRESAPGPRWCFRGNPRTLTSTGPAHAACGPVPRKESR